jgi:hypothetical protein
VQSFPTRLLALGMLPQKGNRWFVKMGNGTYVDSVDVDGVDVDSVDVDDVDVDGVDVDGDGW